jgi:CheY-like chemotaxis protein
LLAEDNVVNQKVTARMLAKCGYQADIACDGREVLLMLQRQDYHLILMDVHMPEMSGLEATRHIRHDQCGQWRTSYQQIPQESSSQNQNEPIRVTLYQPYIIAMTGNLLDGDAEICLAAGMNDYINKPVRTEELSKALRKAIIFIESIGSGTRRLED